MKSVRHQTLGNATERRNQHLYLKLETLFSSDKKHV